MEYFEVIYKIIQVGILVPIIKTLINMYADIRLIKHKLKIK